MNNSDQSLDRLLRAAAQYRPALDDEMPYGFGTRVTGAWVSALAAERPGLEMVWFRRSFLCALALTAMAVTWSYKTDTTAPSVEVSLASYDASADLQ
jgi:GH15 family glucan-1,4-alpha-glucosidase